MLGLDTIKDIGSNVKDFFKKILPSFGEAWGKAKDAKDKGFFERIGLFFSKFSEEMKRLGEEKDEISEDARKAAAKTVEATMEDANTAVKLDESKVGKADAGAYKEAVATTIKAEKSLDANQQAHAIESVKKLTKAFKEGKSDSLSGDEFRAIGGIVLMTLKDLKNKYPGKDKLEAAMKQIADASDHTQYPLKKLLTNSIWKILNPGIMAGVSLANDLGVSGWKMIGFKRDMALMKEKNLTPEKEKTLCDTMHKYILPHTSDTAIKKVITIIRSVGPKEGSDKVSGALSLDKLADIVHVIHVEDFVRLIKIFTGKTVTANA